jgi:hypothetical protein
LLVGLVGIHSLTHSIGGILEKAQSDGQRRLVMDIPFRRLASTSRQQNYQNFWRGFTYSLPHYVYLVLVNVGALVAG